MFARWMLMIAVLHGPGLSAEGKSCDGSTPQAVAKAYSTAVMEDDFPGVLACLAPPGKGILFVYFWLQAGASSRVFTGQGHTLSDVDFSPETPEGKAFLALLERNGIKLEPYEPDERLGKEASEEEVGLRFLEVAGPDPDRAIVELDQFLRKTANIALGHQLMSSVVKASVTDVQVTGDTATATMGSQIFELVRYEGSWYVSNPWNLSLRR